MVSGAIEGAANNGSLVWVLERERLRRAVPDAAGGANWASEDWFCEPLIPRLGDRMRVLDLGCGAGRISRLTAPCVGHLTCVDVSGLLLDEARENLAHLPNLDFVHTSGYSLSPLDDASFDLVYAQGVLSYLDPIAALALLDGVYRVLRPGGASYINFYTVDQPAGREYALYIARTVAQRGRIPGSSSKPYINEQVKKMHSLVGLDVAEVIQPSSTAERETTIFVAARGASTA
ncbi:MAG TPA: class I SAM-dependent methyltransferase [Solirubrobacteraceae bacterium]